jgi:hypothetical protein
MLLDVPVMELLKDAPEVILGQQSGDVQGQRTVDHGYPLYAGFSSTVQAVRHLDRDLKGKISYL